MTANSRTIACGLVIALGCTLGCNSETTPPEPKNGSEMLERLVTAYHAASSYEDAGEMRLQYTADGKPVLNNFNFSLAFVRPNKMRLQIYGANVVSDGKDFSATIPECPNQVLRLPAPPVIGLKDVLGVDDLLLAAIEQGGSASAQLSFLLDPEPLSRWLENTREAPQLLAPSKIDEFLCQRVEVKHTAGSLVFWIDAASYVLRRIEYPTDALRTYLSQEGKVQITDLKLVANMHGAKFDPKIDAKAFVFEAPADAKLVQKFTVPGSMQLPPPKLLGSQIPDFEFTGMDGKPVTKKTLAGKVVVLEFWTSWCAPCFESLPQLQQVYDEYRNNAKVVILAVNLDRAPGSKNVMMLSSASQIPLETPVLDDKTLQEGFAKSKLSIPIVRDLGQFANSAFGVQPIPDLFILGPDGTVEDNETGVNPDLYKQLPSRIEKLLAGGHLIEDARERYAARVKQLEAQQATGAGDPNQPPPKAAIAPRKAPARFTLTKLWGSDAAKKAGNILIVDRPDGAKRIFVNDGWDTVVELGARDGQVEATRKLDLPESSKSEDRIVTYLRTATDKEGQRYFAGSMNNGSQIHLFDANWKRLLSYPGLDFVSAGGISDFEFGDLDGDGTPELNVGYYETVGVQGVSLAGKRVWRNPGFSNVLRLAVTGPDSTGQRHLLCAHERGTIATIDARGQAGPALTLGNRFVRSVLAEDLNGDGQHEYLAIASVQAGQDSLVGFDLTGRELWSHSLPIGLQHFPALEMVTNGILLADGTRQWIAVGPDGSIVVIAADGKLVDQWQYGDAISGIGVAQADGPVLIVATAKGVEAWRVK